MADNHNAHGDERSLLTVDQRDLYFMQLPKELREYITVHCPDDWCERDVYTLYRQYGIKNTIKLIRAHSVQNGRRLWTPGHPDLKYLYPEDKK